VDSGVAAASACDDNETEQNGQNDTWLPDNPSMNVLGYRIAQFMCASDPDWYRVQPNAGEVEVYVNPSDTLRVTAQFVKEAENGAVTTYSPEQGSGLGAPLSLAETVDDPGAAYWIRITAEATEEGPYCAVPFVAAGQACDDDGDGDDDDT
jgi:hypothetical protein